MTTGTFLIHCRDGGSSGGTSRWIFPPEKNPFVGEGESSSRNDNDAAAAQLNDTHTSEVSFSPSPVPYYHFLVRHGLINVLYTYYTVESCQIIIHAGDINVFELLQSKLS